jgi:hypothetical protein
MSVCVCILFISGCTHKTDLTQQDINKRETEEVIQKFDTNDILAPETELENNTNCVAYIPDLNTTYIYPFFDALNMWWNINANNINTEWVVYKDIETSYFKATVPTSGTLNAYTLWWNDANENVRSIYGSAVWDVWEILTIQLDTSNMYESITDTTVWKDWYTLISSMLSNNTGQNINWYLEYWPTLDNEWKPYPWWSKIRYIFTARTKNNQTLIITIPQTTDIQTLTLIQNFLMSFTIVQ